MPGRLSSGLLLVLLGASSGLIIHPLTPNLPQAKAIPSRLSSAPFRPMMNINDPSEPSVSGWTEPPEEPKRDLFIPILVGVSFAGYGLIILYDVFFGNGLCGVTVTCSQSPW